MSAVGEQRFADYVRRLFGLRESSALELIPDVMPVAPVMDATDPIAVAARREREAAGYVTAAGTAAQWNHVALLNPAGSGVVVVASARWNGITNGCQAGLAEEATIAALGTAFSTKGWRDSRLLLTTSPVAQLKQGTTGGISIGASSLVPQVQVDGLGFVERCILLPGKALVIDSIGVNEAIRVAFTWSERLAAPDDNRPPAA